MPHILFACTGNSCRSIMAEALLNHLGSGRFSASSGGVHPSGYVLPPALEILQKYGVPTRELTSKTLEDAMQTPTDMLITVCDHAAQEPCPFIPVSMPRAHWSIPDPAAIEGNEAMRRDACDTVYHRLHHLLSGLMGLSWNNVSTSELASRITALDAR